MRNPVHAWIYFVVTVAFVLPMAVWSFYKFTSHYEFVWAALSIWWITYGCIGMRRWRRLK